MDWEGREALEHREAGDSYFGSVESEDEVPFEADHGAEEQTGFEDGLAGDYTQGLGAYYEIGWERGNLVKARRDEQGDSAS